VGGTVKIIGINGVARSGKDTLAGFLVEDHGFDQESFAAPIRQCVSLITGIPMADLIDGPLKEQPIEWLGCVTPRYLMQTLGTEWGRQLVHPEIWLRVMERKLYAAADRGVSGVAISDVRFDNEAEFVRETMNGTVVSVERPGVKPVQAHASEAGIARGLIDQVIRNDGSLEDLRTKAQVLGN
jgi:hypothetical protein